MKAPSDYLVAAKRCELRGLQQLGCVICLVLEIAELIHSLQRERGASNLFLGAGGEDSAQQRERVALVAQDQAHAIRMAFAELAAQGGESASSMRLFNRIAQALIALDSLPALRVRIESKQLSSDAVIDAYSAVIMSLLVLVSEAVDVSADAATSRLLIALFYLMHGKELAGQERATGVKVFASGKLSDEQRERLLRLIESSEHCIGVFLEYAEPASQQAWHDLQASEVTQRLERMRRSLLASHNSPANSDAALDWFADASMRLDLIREMEESLCASLRQLCAERIETVQRDLEDHTSLLEKISAKMPPLGVLMEGPTIDLLANSTSLANCRIGPLLGGSVVELLQSQARRIEQAEDELAKATTRFNESILVERAKGVLMARQGVSAEQAHRLLRQTAMNQNRRLVDIAQAALTLVDLIPQRQSGDGREVS